MKRLLPIALLLFAASIPSGGIAQSLWTDAGSSEVSLIADPIARKVGDVVTILVVERLSVQDDGKIETSKASALDSKIEVFDVKPNTFDTLPALAYSSERSVDGESKYSAQGKIEMTISARVVDVQKNGALLIEGRRTLYVDGDRKRMIVRGVVRPLDVSERNTVPSDRIADAEVRFENVGPRSNATRKNWLETLLDFIWPF